MKYTKTVPYFKKGDKVKKRVEVGNTGKTKEEIMAEARSNQTREKAQQAMDREAKLAAENRKKASAPSVGAGFKRPTAVIIGPVDTRSGQIENTVGKKTARTRGEAFQQARARGDSEFLWQGKRYHTRTAEEEAERKAKEIKTSAGTDVPGQSSASRRVSLGNRPKTRIGIIPKYVNDSPYELSSNEIAVPQIPSNYVFPTPPEITEAEAEAEAGQSFIPRTVSLGNGFRSNIGLNSKYISPLELSGNEITAPWIPPNYVFPETTEPEPETEPVPEAEAEPEVSENILIRNNSLLNGFIPINKTRIGLNPKYVDNSPFFTTKSFLKSGGTINKFQQGDKLHLRNTWERMFGITPDYTPVNSQESITSYMDNTYKGPVEKRVIRKKVPYANLYSTMSIRNPRTNRADTTFTAPSGTKYDMNDVRSGKAPSGYSYKFFRKPAGYFQQGGEVQQQPQMTEEDLIMDFTVRYLSALGVAPEDIMDQEGNLNPVYVEEITNVFQQGDIDWESYVASPDEYIQQFVGSRMQMARKGAKLKRLSQLRIYKK